VQNLDPDLRSLQEVRDMAERAWRACEAVHGYSQAQIDRVGQAMAEAGARAAYDLARLAVEETGMGRVHYKILKNLLGSEGTWASIAAEKTVGVIARDERLGISEIATPVGVIAGIIPTTNPTSTALFKALIAVKGRNAIVISPHPRARRCIGETVEVLRRAIERCGAPPDLVQSLSNPTIESTGALMRHPRVSVILATGGSGLVQAAYSSGKPAYGVGPGNVPAYVDRSADVKQAARGIVQSQSFDNGTLCCSEQALVLDRPIADAVLAEMKRAGAHLCDAAQTDLLARLCSVRGHMNPEVVGKDPSWIAEQAGFSVPRDTTVLLAYQGGVGREWPLSIEILAPVLSVHLVDGWREGCAVSMATLRSDGLGHTCSVWAKDEAVIEAWALEKPANRILVNCPASQGAVGYATHLVPSMSLGCGPQAGNITSDNISARHLINVKRVAHARRDWPDIERRDHERAARMGGDASPRGALLPGEPAAGRRERPIAVAPSSGGGSGGSAAPARTGGASASVAARPSAPRFTATALAAAQAVARPEVAPRNAMNAATSTATLVARRPAPHQVGAMLSPNEIQTILTHAGSGCPLGPCQGCPHNNVQSGACEA
jgi:acetaldehyde dehydrogenase (acetylating)